MSGFLNALSQGSDLMRDSKAPVNTDGAASVPSFLSKKMKDTPDIPAVSLSDLPAYIDAVKHLRTGIDDRKFLLEKLLVLMSRLPMGSQFSHQLEIVVLDALYKDLPHPPSGYLGPPRPPRAVAALDAAKFTTTPARDATYAFRSADGSNYNILFSTFGQAGSPYARSVPSSNYTPDSCLPDPGLIFDTLLRRGHEDFQPHPGGISSMFFAFADLVIHSIFDTDHADWRYNNASSYLDLSPLYGSSETAVASVRRNDGTGRLWDDVYADYRLTFMPPSTCALLVILNRNHNYIASKILDINERGKLSNPPPDDTAARQAQDDEIFHRARLVNSGFFMQIILGDYVGAILGLVRDGRAWRLNPREMMRQMNHELTPRGEGNVCSVEFNLMYRWHATLSAQDTKWTEDSFRYMFGPHIDFKELSIRDFKEAAHKFMIPTKSVKDWTFGDLTRDANGRFNDEDLARILQNATEWPAGAFRARGTPEVLRVIEIMSIEQARSWGTCSMNEFRRFMGLKPYASFRDWNPDPEIYHAAEALYQDIENLELHVGLQAEQAKNPMPGAGLCPGYTISRAILADAVCLTRGDRFMTTEFTPFNFTSWGYQDCQYNPDDGSYGGMLTKLLFRHLPNHYPPGSAYAHFPFLVPDFIQKALAKHHDSPVDKYNWTRPLPAQLVVVIDDPEGVLQVLSERQKFVSDHDARVFRLTKGAVLDHNLVKHVLFSESNLKRWADSFARLTEHLIKENSLKYPGTNKKYIDIVKDVVNLIPVYWIANEIVGLPFKTHQNPKGVLREQELYDGCADVGNYVISSNVDHENDWTLRERAGRLADVVIRFAKAHLVKLSKGTLSVDFSDSVIRWVAGANDHSDTFLKGLLDAGNSSRLQELSASMFAEVVPTVAHWSHAVTHVVNFVLDDTQKVVYDDIRALSSEARTSEGDLKLLSYVYQALSVDPPVSGVYRTAYVDTVLSGSAIKAGQRVFASVHRSSPDDPVFAARKPIILGLENCGLLSHKFFEMTVLGVLRAIFKLPNIERGPGKSGQLTRFKQLVHDTPLQFYVNLRGEVTPFPASLVVKFESDSG